MEFETSDRKDLQYDLSTAPKKLDWLRIYYGTEEVKSYNFSYSYFNDGYLSDPDKHLYLRLKLDSLTEYAKNSEALPPHEFVYNGIELPEKTSTSTDSWGYYNGQTNKDFYGRRLYAPEQKVTVDLENFGWKETSRANTLTLTTYDYEQKYLPGANKEVGPNYMQAAILEKIKYPTGGATELTYEPNSFYNLVEEYVQEIVDSTALACKGSSCNKYEFLNPPIPETAAKMFYLSEETSVLFSFLSSNFLENCNTFTFPDGATNFSFLDKVDANGTFISRPLIFTYGDFSNQDCANVGYPNYSYHNYEVLLDPGWYEMTVTPFDGLDGEMTMTYSKNTTERVYSKLGGGLRIAKIKNDATERLFKYEQDVFIDNENRSVSSGRLLSKPNNIFLETRYGLCSNISDPTPNPEYSLNAFALLNRSSSSIYPLTGHKSGNSIGYDKVSEIIMGSNGEESILEQTYYNLEEVQTLPFFPNLPRYNNGLLKTESYLANGVEIKRKELFYKKDSAHSYFLKGMRYINDILGFYQVYSEWWYPYRTIETNYDQNGENPLTTTTYLEYANSSHKLLTSSTLQDSKGKTVVESFTYPSDSGSGAPLEMYDENRMHFKHMLGSLVEKEVSVDGTTVSKTNYAYNYDSAKDMILLHRSSFYPKRTSEGFNVNHSYNTVGKLIERTRDYAPSTYYIWGYNNQYPIAEIKNFDSDDATPLQTLITNAKNASDLDTDRTLDVINSSSRDYVGTEGDLRKALDKPTLIPPK